MQLQDKYKVLETLKTSYASKGNPGTHALNALVGLHFKEKLGLQF